MVSKAVGMGINVQINRTRLVRMGRQCGGAGSVGAGSVGGSSGFAFAWLTRGMVAKDNIGDPKSDTKANLLKT